jgi:acetyltransferase-like isoleucine patch superfamily enzyme
VGSNSKNTAMKSVSGRGLPRPAAGYGRQPGQTLMKTIDWLRGKWLLRSCTSVGAWTRVTGRVHIRNQGQVIIGERVQILAHFVPSIFVVLRGGKLEIGDRTMVNYGADIAVTSSVVIGRDCLIGTHVIILDNDFHDPISRLEMPAAKPVRVEDRVWIGNRVTILPGVTIGHDSVVGAGAVVTSDVRPRSVVAGNPARVLRQI